MEPTLKVREICDSILAVVRLMVDQPQDATITAQQLTPEAATIKLRVAKTDAGKVIGKSGRNARSLRALLEAILLDSSALCASHNKGLVYPVEIVQREVHDL